MELGHSLRLKQQSKLVMTPQLQQVIRLLQLPMADLVDLVRQELEANPVLEESGEAAVDELPAERKEPQIEDDPDAWLSLAAQGDSPGIKEVKPEDDEAPAREFRLSVAQSLQDYLLDQLRIWEGPREEAERVAFLIGNLDDSGYLTTPLEELANVASGSTKSMERALRVLQTFEPRGVGARDLKECLLLQLRARPGETTHAQRLVMDHLERLGERTAGLVGSLARELGVTGAQVEEALRQIRACDPKPGGRFAATPPAILPDARIDRIGKDYVVSLNDAGVPPLRLSKSYREMLANRDRLKDEDRRFLQERFRAALMLMRGIEQRRVTLHRVVEHMAKAQRAFLDRGPVHLKPLTLKEVAEAIGVHESTVSRVVANKYVVTPRGVFALKDFFSNRLPGSGGGEASGAAARERLRALIENEDAASPLSDEQLAEALRREGIAIARRTVTKYREALKLPPAWQRRASAADAGKLGGALNG